MVPIIFTDASCDLPRNFIDENNIPFLGLMCNFKGRDWEDDLERHYPMKNFIQVLKRVKCLLPVKLMNIGLKKNLKNY